MVAPLPATAHDSKSLWLRQRHSRARLQVWRGLISRSVIAEDEEVKHSIGDRPRRRRINRWRSENHHTARLHTNQSRRSPRQASARRSLAGAAAEVGGRPVSSSKPIKRSKPCRPAEEIAEERRDVELDAIKAAPSASGVAPALLLVLQVDEARPRRQMLLVVGGDRVFASITATAGMATDQKPAGTRHATASGYASGRHASCVPGAGALVVLGNRQCNRTRCEIADKVRALRRPAAGRPPGRLRRGSPEPGVGCVDSAARRAAPPVRKAE